MRDLDTIVHAETISYITGDKRYFFLDPKMNAHGPETEI